MHHAIGETVECVALFEHPARDQLAFGLGKRTRDVGQTGKRTLRVYRTRRGYRGILLRPVDTGHSCLGQVEARRADEIAIVFIGIARCRDHRMASPIGTATDVGIRWPLPVRRAQDGLGHWCQFAHGLVPVVQTGLGIDSEGRVLLGVVTSIRTQHGKSLQQCTRQCSTTTACSNRGNDVPVEPAVGLVEETAIPTQGQPHLELNGIGTSIDRADTLVHLAGQYTMSWDIVTRHLELTRHNTGCCGEHGIREMQRVA